MARAQKAKNQEANQPQNATTQPQLEANEQTQTPPSRQAGSNQPGQGMPTPGSTQQGMTADRGRRQPRGLSRRDELMPMNPFSLMRRLTDEMDRLFEDFSSGRSMLSPGRDLLSQGFGRGMEHMFDWSPQTEVFRRGNELVIRADLPGLTKDDINIDLEDDQIVIRGERRDEREEDREGFYHSERSYGSFYRAIPLPEGIDADQADASFNNGVLEITIPIPASQSRGRRIEIKGGETGRGTSGGGR